MHTSSCYQKTTFVFFTTQSSPVTPQEKNKLSLFTHSKIYVETIHRILSNTTKKCLKKKTDTVVITGLLQKHFFEKNSKIHRKAPVMKPFFRKTADMSQQLYCKRLNHKCFPVSFANFFRISIL